MPLSRLQEKLKANWESPDLPVALEICSGTEVLGIGGRRIVIAADGGVAKLAWKEAGLLDNEIEWLLWSSASSELRSLLCPTHALTAAGVALQELCLPVSFEALGQRGREAMHDLASHGISDVAVNLGLLDDRVVCYDYCAVSADLYRGLFGL